MNEPVTGTVVAASVSAFSIATLFPTLQAPVVLGALCGALLLVISQKEIGLFLRIIILLRGVCDRPADRRPVHCTGRRISAATSDGKSLPRYRGAALIGAYRQGAAMGHPTTG